MDKVWYKIISLLLLYLYWWIQGTTNLYSVHLLNSHVTYCTDRDIFKIRKLSLKNITLPCCDFTQILKFKLSLRLPHFIILNKKAL